MCTAFLIPLCLCLPPRFEPCGLVDIEFGWNGALIIGHDTGGLGKVGFRWGVLFVLRPCCDGTCVRNGDLIIGHDTGGLGRVGWGLCQPMVWGRVCISPAVTRGIIDNGTSLESRERSGGDKQSVTPPLLAP